MQAGNLRGVGRPSNVAVAATRPKVQHKIRFRSCACETSLSIASYFRVMPAASYIKRPVFDPAVPRLFIIDGSKALAWAIRRSFGRNTAIQRCQTRAQCPSGTCGVLYARTYCPRSSATTRLRRLGATTCSSCSVDARLMRGTACIGMVGLSVSRPPFMNTTRCSVTWHAEQMNVWFSRPRTATVSSGTTFVRINSAPQADGSPKKDYRLSSGQELRSPRGVKMSSLMLKRI